MHARPPAGLAPAALAGFLGACGGTPSAPVLNWYVNPDNGGHSVCSACFTITGPTSVSIATPSTVNGPIVATFSQPVSGVSSSNSFVRFTGHTYNLATTITCADQDGFVTSCATGFCVDGAAGFKKVLVMQTAFLGDSLLTLPLLRRLKELLPEATVTVLTLAKTADIFRGADELKGLAVDDALGLLVVVTNERE